MRFGAFALPQADGDIIPARAGVRHVSSTLVLMQRHEDAYQDQYRCLQAGDREQSGPRAFQAD